ncbi:hypothetical protein [Scopulibacillus daqui]|uniref:hypothetical protein n=1 Tax=Scopulibacillus daqui TaxID=1469162 RepID=UPI001961B1F2|nr:hypothetical protein [Scopulibacillus daqui]
MGQRNEKTSTGECRKEKFEEMKEHRRKISHYPSDIAEHFMARNTRVPASVAAILVRGLRGLDFYKRPYLLAVSSDFYYV